jgi:hypothetical protein
MSTRCPLLKLPAELRNRKLGSFAIATAVVPWFPGNTLIVGLAIYKSVLSTSAPLSIHSPQVSRRFEEYKKYDLDLDTFNSGSSHADFNKIKYVNKQLYCETTGLEFKYNETKIE